MSPPVVTATRLHKRFRRHVAVRDLSFDVYEGQVMGLLGPNGAGKTTTMKMLTGLVHPTSGSAAICGLPAGDPQARHRMGYLPEQFLFPDWMTGIQVLQLHADLAGLHGLGDDDIDAALDRVGLSGRGADRIAHYSKGMQQRLGVAQALLGDPAAVLLDEPTSALDPIGRRHIRAIIRDLADRGVAIIVNSHLLSEVEVVCDRVVIMDRGRNVRSGALDELAMTTIEVRVELNSVDDEALRLLGRHGTLGASDARTVIVAVDDVEVVAAIAEDVVAAGYRLRALVPLRRSLEDLFVGLVEGAGQ